jgi:Spy/CpxP family protein refolding chaperone
MNKPASPSLDSTQNWRDLVEAAIFETNPDNLSRRIQDAQDAIMDQIEDSFQSASQSERQAMINAMNSLRELRRLLHISGSQVGTHVAHFSDA